MTRFNSYLGAAAVVALLTAAGGASAAVVTFDSFHSATTIANYGSHYEEAGLSFDVASLGGVPEAIGAFGFPLAADADPVGGAIFVNASSAKITISKTGGGAFDFDAIDLTDQANGQLPRSNYDLNYTYVDGGGSHAGVFKLDSTAGLQTFTLNWVGVTSLTMFTGDTNANTAPGVQLDNVRFNSSLTTPTGAPEPAAWALMLVGFGGMGALLRRRRAATA